jgi:hypothetical protein
MTDDMAVHEARIAAKAAVRKEFETFRNKAVDRIKQAATHEATQPDIIARCLTRCGLRRAVR